MHNQPYDFAIVGGGIVGVSAAYWLTRNRPGWRILLVERSLLGNGASGHSAGLATTLSTESNREMLSQSIQFYEEVRDQLPSIPIRSVPVYFIIARDRLSSLSDRLGGTELCETESEVAIDPVFNELKLASNECTFGVAHAHLGDVGAICRALVGNLRESEGFEIWEGVDAIGLTKQGNSVGIELGDGRTIVSQQALLALGPWILRSPVRDWAISKSIRLKKVVALHLRREARDVSPVVYIPESEAFLVPLPDRGEWLFSFRCDEWDCQPEAGSLRITVADRLAGLELLGRYFPGLRNAYVGGRVFCDAYTEDKTPLSCLLDGWTNVAVATGASGSGFKLGPAMALMALQALA